MVDFPVTYNIAGMSKQKALQLLNDDLHYNYAVSIKISEQMIVVWQNIIHNFPPAKHYLYINYGNKFIQ